MIVFDGYMSGDAKTTCIKSKLHNGSKLPVIFLLFSVPIWAFLAYKTDTLLPVMCSLFIMIILSPFVFRLLISKKSQEHMNLKKVVIKDNVIKGITDEMTVHNNISNVIEVRDFEDYYEIVFPAIYIFSVYICQKNLLIKGTLEDFEALFEDKIVRVKDKT